MINVTLRIHKENPLCDFLNFHSTTFAMRERRQYFASIIMNSIKNKFGSAIYTALGAEAHVLKDCVIMYASLEDEREMVRFKLCFPEIEVSVSGNLIP